LDIVADEFEPRCLEGLDELDEAVDHAAHLSVARFHALDRGQGKPRLLGQRALVDAEEGTGGADLGRGDHVGCDSLGIVDRT